LPSYAKLRTLEGLFPEAGECPRRASNRTIDAALEWCESHEDQWYIVELLRIRSELLMPSGNDVQAAVHLRAALERSHRQDALAWELRAATSFARMLQRQGLSDDARAILAPVYERFTEGFETPDLRTARTQLAALIPR
jgi:predicted ATPase